MSKVDTQAVLAADIQTHEQTQSANMLQLTMTALRLTTSAITATAKAKAVEGTLKEITLDEVSQHDNRLDCWIIIYDRVYDVTLFLDIHPGGYDVLLEYAGRDASFAFRGTGHSEHAIKLLKKYEIGVLPLHECIFRTPTGIKISNLPE